MEEVSTVEGSYDNDSPTIRSVLIYTSPIVIIHILLYVNLHVHEHTVIFFLFRRRHHTRWYDCEL